MSKFVVGEVAVVAYSLLPAYPVGTEVTILAVPSPAFSPSHQYLIHDGPRDQVYACDQCLRKKRPPGRTDAELVAALIRKLYERSPEEQEA
jgi:hypothetical protein